MMWMVALWMCIPIQSIQCKLQYKVYNIYIYMGIYVRTYMYCFFIYVCPSVSVVNWPPNAAEVTTRHCKQTCIGRSCVCSRQVFSLCALCGLGDPIHWSFIHFIVRSLLYSLSDLMSSGMACVWVAAGSVWPNWFSIEHGRVHAHVFMAYYGHARATESQLCISLLSFVILCIRTTFG